MSQHEEEWMARRSFEQTMMSPREEESTAPYLRSGLKSDPLEVSRVSESTLAYQQAHHRDSPWFEQIGPHDVMFQALRLVIFRIDERSATPIAHLLREELNDAEVFQLIDDYHSSAMEKAPKLPNKIKLATSVSIYKQDEIVKAKSVSFAKLRAKMEYGRKKHATNLRNGDFVDVDIMYHGDEAKLHIFINDKMRIAASRQAKIFHLWPYNTFEIGPKRVGMGVIVKRVVLESIYPPERLAEGNIKISVNTKPAPRDLAPPPLQKEPLPSYSEPLFSYSQPPQSCTKGHNPMSVPSVKLQDLIREASNESSSSSSHVRNASVEAVMSAEKKSWNHYGSGLRIESPQPQWSWDEQPFTRESGPDNNAWWKSDFVSRRAQIDEWDKKTWRPSGDKIRENERRLSEQPAQRSVLGVDFEVLSGLSNTHVPDRNYQWHRDNIEAAEAREMQEARLAAEKG